MSCGIDLLSNITANCTTIGGLDANVWIGRLPANVDKAADGSIYGFDLGRCGKLIKAKTKPEKNTLDSALTDTDNGAVVEPTLTVVFFHGGQQSVISRIDKLLAAENLFAVVEYQAGYFRVAGLDGGLSANGGNDTSGTASTDPNNITVTLSGTAGVLNPVVRRGTLEQTREYLDGLTKVAKVFKLESIVPPTAETDSIGKLDVVGQTVVGVASNAIYISQNGGKTYAKISDAYVDIVRVSEKVGFAVQGNSLLKTTNQFASTTVLNANLFGGNYAGQIAEHDGLLYVTGAGRPGIAVEVYDQSGTLVKEYTYPDASTDGSFNLAVSCGVVLISQEEALYKGTVDGTSLTLVLADIAGEDAFNQVKILSENTYLYLDDDESEVYRTNDGGETWEVVLSYDQQLYQIAVLDCQTLAISGKNAILAGIIYISQDGGKTWAVQTSTVSDTNLVALAWIDEETLVWGGFNNSTVEQALGRATLDCNSITC